MSGAINQVINYRDSLMKEYSDLVRTTSRAFTAFNPKCAVIIGQISEMEHNQIPAFENYRNRLNNIVVITYDEILLRLKDLRSLFSQSDSIENLEEDEEYPF